MGGASQACALKTWRAARPSAVSTSPPLRLILDFNGNQRLSGTLKAPAEWCPSHCLAALRSSTKLKFQHLRREHSDRRFDLGYFHVLPRRFLR